MASSADGGSELIPFNDLARIPSDLRDEIDSAIARVVSSGWFVLGPEHDAFENELAQYVGVDHVVLAGNGTDALELALAALGVGPGDPVVTVANAGGYTTIATRLLGGVPVYADVADDSLQASVESVRAAFDAAASTPRALVVTHLFGAMAPVEALVAFARERGVPVIEDVAQAIGSRVEAGMAGSFGDLATTSFYPTKNLGALGDGGAVMTSNADLAASVRRMRQYGWDGKYNIAYPHGRNSRLDEMQAAILRVKLPHLDAWNARRREIHSPFEAASSPALRVLNRASESYNGHLAVVRAEDRDAARAHFLALGIRTDVHYPIPDNRQALIVAEGAQPPLPVTERASVTQFSLPLFPELRDDEVERICAAMDSLT